MKLVKFLIMLLVLAGNYACKKTQEAAPATANETRLATTEATTIVVAKDGSGNYTTVQAALNAVPDNSSSRTVINIKNGTYKEVITVASTKKNVSIIGESATGVKLTYDNYASKINPATGAAYGTGGSASTFINAEGFYAQNIVFENSSGPVGQALAINISGDKSVFNTCRFLGRQDTWYAGNVRSYLKNCYIEGTTDFIFGPATAFFDGCSLYSYGGSALTAASTESYVTYGFVFNNCTVTGASGVSTVMGRTWRPYAATAFLNSSLSSIIAAAGWSDWGSSSNDATARYREYNNTGAGASTAGRVSWSRVLTSAEAASYSNFKTVLKTTYASSPVTDNWDPSLVIANPSGTTLTSGATYSIIAKHSGKGLDVKDGSTADGGTIQQWGYGGQSNQKFIINDVGGGYYNIVNVNSGKCLDVTGSSTSNGALVQQWGYAATANQQWTIESTSDGYFKIINRNSGKCLDVQNASTSSGALIQQYTFANGSNQLWQLNRL